MGTWTHRELADSQVYTVTDRWGEQRIERVFLSEFIPANNTDFPTQAMILNNLPVKPQTRLEAGILGSPVDPHLRSFVCQSVNVSPAREKLYTWRVRATYASTNYPYNDTPWGLAYCKQTRTSQIRSTPIWKGGSTLTFPTNGDVTWPAASAITTGTSVDLNGNPRTRRVVQQQIQIEVLQDRTPISPATAAVDPNWSNLYGYVNKRNSVAFLGWAIGTLACTGITATLDNHVWRFVVTFVADDWYHLEQIALPHPNGEPRLLPGQTIAGTQYLQATSVVWSQPFPDKVDFGLMFGNEIKDQFTLAGPIIPV